MSIIKESFLGYFHYLVHEISNPGWTNYFYWLISLSLLVWFLELWLPWRKDQKALRKDFWLDGFYMFFNFFIFSLIGYNALSNIGVQLFADFLHLFGLNNIVAIEIGYLPKAVQLLIMFVVADFIQWNLHRQLHKRDWLWQFHKVHHSVKEMGFATQFRFHFFETLFYKSFQYIPLAMIGFGISEFFVIHILAILIGHLNHANLEWSYGKLGYIFNNPKMHIWHHAKELPEEHPQGMNFGISLSLWDYIFGTAYIPENGKKTTLGFEGDEDFPQKFASQLVEPFRMNKKY